MIAMATRESTRARAWPAAGQPASRASPDAFGDIFGDIFNQAARGRSSVYRGADLRYNLEVALEPGASARHRNPNTHSDLRRL